jgi:inositol polyphosphate 1-phosphatase
LKLFPDSTAQYIQGDVGNEVDGLVNEGLQCVAVLIGVYHKSTGLPLIGVTNQPFYKLQDSRYSMKSLLSDFIF